MRSVAFGQLVKGSKEHRTDFERADEQMQGAAAVYDLRLPPVLVYVQNFRSFA